MMSHLYHAAKRVFVMYKALCELDTQSDRTM
jgi:hypothetical protein